MVTAKDVAERAGVSQATVSYVMSGSRPISEATKVRVRQAVNELGYFPNANARALAGSRTNVIGVVVDLGEHVQMEELRPFLNVIMNEAAARDYDVMLMPAQEGIEGVARLVGQGMVDGLVVFDIGWHDSRLVDIANLHIPVVLIGTAEDSHGVCSVDVDYQKIANMAVNQLAADGAQGVLLYCDEAHGRSQYSFSKFFENETRIVSRVLDMQYFPFVIPEPGWRGVWASQDLVRDVARNHGGIAIRTPQILDYVLQLLVEMGLKANEDLPIVAVYPDEHAHYLRIPITNVDPEPGRVAKEVMLLLFKQIEGEQVPERIAIDPHVTIRN